MVSGISGFSNFSDLLNGLTNMTIVGGTYRYVYNITNWGNTNMILNVPTYSENYTGNYGNDWDIEFYNKNSDSLINTTISVSPSDSIDVELRVTPDIDADNNAQLLLYLTNSIANDVYFYQATNGYIYGGINSFFDHVYVSSLNSSISISRNYAVTNDIGGNEINKAVPGAIVYFTLSYMNTSSLQCTNINIIEQLPTYLNFVNNSVVLNSSGDSIDYSSDGNNFNYTPSGNIDESVTSLRFTIPSLNRNTSGDLHYQTVIR